MIKVFYGRKGMGKTKQMLENANNIVNSSSGNVVYIDDSSELSIKLSHKISRFRLGSVSGISLRGCFSEL